ncbi:MAG: segregation/condensation protein A [Rhodospirillaceae bacterium]|jgi:segregation and condensation protein A|nr:segregation/condensation protein A [Rhodospirillales bacterium]MBT3906020.1 segregation/condensation protein A [Rhodospirillaceae bacterium]MBT5036039.1 segregation/condensation protein A [Rhodospirillaceae bacterium]MBT6220577.1 segregation/condensation protein A [Rhodospirillaceae bacterium]MBT6362732.1 segregation/condensation protein A [Rhodospirillaceae bacterium]
MADLEAIEEFEGEGAPSINPFVVDIDGYEGPIDALLQLARDQKVDLAQISILQLADQYLEFIAQAQKVNLELAADYLVMAAWLAYMKSRLLLPDLGNEDEPSGQEMADALAFQIRRLEAMQKAGEGLLARPQLGEDFYDRGDPEEFVTNWKTVIDVTLYDLLKAYGDQASRAKGDGTLHIEPWELFSVEDALSRLRKLVGHVPDWSELSKFLPEGMKDGISTRSAVASTLSASLEMAKEGKLKIRQDGTFAPIYIRAAGDPSSGNTDS